MFISEFLSDTDVGLASFTLHIYSTVNNYDKIDRFTITDRDRLNGFETILLLHHPMLRFTKFKYQRSHE